MAKKGQTSAPNNVQAGLPRDERVYSLLQPQPFPRKIEPAFPRWNIEKRPRLHIRLLCKSAWMALFFQTSLFPHRSHTGNRARTHLHKLLFFSNMSTKFFKLHCRLFP
jgi:hypothetical protein